MVSKKRVPIRINLKFMSLLQINNMYLTRIKLLPNTVHIALSALPTNRCELSPFIIIIVHLYVITCDAGNDNLGCLEYYFIIIYSLLITQFRNATTFFVALL